MLEKQWLAVDLGAAVELESVRLYWDNATFSFASEYTLSVSNSSDAGDWTVVFRESQGNGGFDEIALPAGTNGRHVRLDCLVARSSPPPPPPPATREMIVGKLYQNSDIASDNVGGRKAKTWEVCKAMCAATMGCTAFIFDTRGAAKCAGGECCWLKKCAPCRTEPAPLHVAMALHEPAAPPPAPPREGGFSLFSFDCFERH